MMSAMPPSQSHATFSAATIAATAAGRPPPPPPVSPPVADVITPRFASAAATSRHEPPDASFLHFAAAACLPERHIGYCWPRMPPADAAVLPPRAHYAVFGRRRRRCCQPIAFRRTVSLPMPLAGLIASCWCRCLRRRYLRYYQPLAVADDYQLPADTSRAAVVTLERRFFATGSIR
jgi:hypothetical protein